MMKPWTIIQALAAVTAVLLLFETEAAHANNQKPTCGLLRNNTPGIPTPAEPNRAETRAAIMKTNVPPSPNDKLPVIHKLHVDGFHLLQKVDQDGTTALSALSPSTPHIDTIINMQLINLVMVRSILGEYYEDGRVGSTDLAAEAAVYQRAVDTTFVDDRGCLHQATPAPLVRIHLAGMYLYGIGVAPDAAKARALFDPKDPNFGPIVTAIDNNTLADNFDRFLVLAANRMIPPEIERQRRLDERTAAVLSFFHLEPQPTPIWIVVLLIAAVVSILVVIVLAIVREVRDKIRASGPPRNFFEVADLAQSAFARLDLFFKGLLITFGTLTTFYGFYVGSLVTSYLSGWFDYIFAGIMAVIVAQGIFSIIAAMRSHTATPNTQAHGSARPASEPEAQSAAIGNTKINDLHDRTFTD